MPWTTDEISDQSQRVIFITGATDGVGRETARALAANKAHLILACRNPTKMTKVADELRELGASSVRELVCDLEDLDSVRTCASAALSALHDISIDVLLLNAGIGSPGPPTAQGYDRVVAINHLGHFLLAALLIHKMKDYGRVVVVSSNSHTAANHIDWNAVIKNQFSSSGLVIPAYAQSKLANLLFVEQLNRKFQLAGKNIVAVGAHPGLAKTHIAHNAPPSIAKSIWMFIMNYVAQPTDHGAWPLLMAVTCENPQPSDYFAPSNGYIMSESFGPPIRNGKKSEAVLDEQLAERCWSESEKLTNCTFVV